MKKLGFLFLSMIFVGAVFGQDGHEAAAPFFTPSIAMALAAGLCGLGQGKAIYSACEGMARNPGAAGDIRTTLLLGLAFIESLVLFTLASIFLG
ncbi:MAG: ATP synthase F0 subunit C [Acidobacteria bacterium]|nr:ATP synthase F0 subunit C [Acidobacteriota bacterium]MCB9396442.1 ATP synthase F0 subunit C [Acidobacteriota bacterium]